MIRAASLGLVLVLLAGAGCRSAPPASLTAGPPAPVRHVLSNGIPVIVQEHRGSDIVSLQLWVRAGARDEGAAELGLAHYLEHMLFRGTTTRPAGFIEREVEAVGGVMNAGTSWDYTFYYLTLPGSRAAAGLDILADIAINASLDADVLDKEKAVVLEEMRLGEDNPRRVLSRELFVQLFAGHPYGRPVIGSSALIRALGRDTLAGFYRRLYIPESFAVVVVGAVNAQETLAAARSAFGGLPRAGASRLPPPPVPTPQWQRREIVRAGTHAYLGLAWPAPRLDHADMPALDLLVSILGRHDSSRLVQALRERDGLVIAVNAGLATLEASGAVMITAQMAPANVPRAEDAVLAEIRRIRDGGVSEAELRRALTSAEAAYEFERETPAGRASALGRAETVWTIEDDRAYINRLRSVTPGQVRAAARRYLDLERYVRLALVPPRREG